MRVLHLCTSDSDGGASIAAYRLHKGLRGLGVESFMLVQDKRSEDPFVLGPDSNLRKIFAMGKKRISSLPLSFYKNKQKTSWSFNWSPDNAYKIINEVDPDIVNLHWIGNGFLNINNLEKINANIVWTLHDMWAFTGGCHYAGSCKMYRSKCMVCPQLGSSCKTDLSNLAFNQKKRVYSKKEINLVVLCRWMEECVKNSFLLSDCKIKRIPNGLDTEIFKPIEKKTARDILNLPKGKKIILFGALNSTSDKRKGFKYLKKSLKILSNGGEKFLLLVFGASYDKDIEKLPFDVKFFGRLNDDFTLSLVYSAADIFVTPSIEDNFPNTVLESFACGTPCVSFDIGGFTDMIDHKKNGYLARHFDSKDLAEGIKFCLSRKELGVNAREKVLKNYTMEIQAKEYLKYYNSLQ